MKKTEIIEKLTNDISRNAYHAAITTFLGETLNYDSNMMEYSSNVASGKAFEAIELLNTITGTTQGDTIYDAAEADANGTIRAAMESPSMETIIVTLLNEAGYDGAAHYAATTKWA